MDLNTLAQVGGVLAFVGSTAFFLGGENRRMEHRKAGDRDRRFEPAAHQR